MRKCQTSLEHKMHVIDNILQIFMVINQAF